MPYLVSHGGPESQTLLSRFPVLGLDSRHGNLSESKEPPKVRLKAREKLEGKGRETETTGWRLLLSPG